jgi:hypothetical protein
MITHALLQKLPPEASKFRFGEVDVLTVGSCEQVERFLAEYRERHKVACREWQAWDDHSREWDQTFDQKHDEICGRHAVNTLIKDVEFEVVPIGVSWQPGPPPEFALPSVREVDDAPDYELDAAHKDALTASFLQVDSLRALVNCAICAGLSVLDDARYADKVQKGFAEYPLFRLLARDPKTPLDADAADALSDVTFAFMNALAPLSPAAQLLNWGQQVPLHRCQTNSGSARIVGSVPLWPREIAFLAFVRRDVLEAPLLDAERMIVRQLLDFAPDHLDRLMFSTDAGLNAAPRGLLYNAKAIELAENGAVGSVIDPKLATAGVVTVAAHRRQVKSLVQRGVLISPAIPKNSMVAVARDGVTSVLGPMRVEAVRQGDRVQLKFYAELAWGLARDGGLRLMKGM